MTPRGINWPHLTSCLLVGVTAVLLCFGALVTTYDAAMAVPDWPATYGHNMFLFPFAEWFWGPWDLFLEHGHRLLGAVVGMITLLLAAIVWAREPNATVRGLVVAAVLLVVVQGALGGARVLLDDKTVAKVHACTGPLFFAVAVAIAALTGRRPDPGDVIGDHANAVRRSGRLTAAGEGTAAEVTGRVTTSLLVAAYVQLVAGAQLRHLDAASISPTAFRWLVILHLLGAFAVTGLAFTAAVACNRNASATARRWSLVIALLVACQLLLGVGAWAVSWGIPSGWVPASWMPAEPLAARSPRGAAVVTGHVVLGMMILGGSVALATATGLFARRTAGSPA
jgi:cytochrome c oxidase assembly protein subunit 15